MTIDTGALRKFVETFGPAVEAIPALLDAVAKQADMDRAAAIYKKELEKSKVAGQKVIEEAQLILANARKSAAETAAEQDAIKAQISADKAKAKKDSAAALASATEKLGVVEAKIKSAQTTLLDVTTAVAAKKTETDIMVADLLAAAKQQCAEFEKRKEAAERALEALKTKLG